ncbi:hypothetical protein HR45_08960 [Shewanella mangrovi]|uniref:Uncharacterized protein n=1 Tax=Shewanella mangrovi TaxID=1515746 RepID=A0A094JHP0_9GAMM|nr:hypothetical protein [Shewanella mangrovi]KFZ37549.1 hypothetical protein HR45_08960 [Shewanella mangrovi]
MQVISNYPQIPIATSNPATDVARAENLQRPPVIPPQQPTSNHEERALNSQNERANVTAQQQARLADTVHERQQSNQQQQQEQGSQQQRQQQSKAQLLQLFTPSKPALDRRDIRNRVVPESNNKTASSAATEPSATQLSNIPEQNVYRQFAQHIGDFYQERSQPQQDAGLTVSA